MDFFNKKIVVFTPTLSIGGIERVLLTYANGLGNKNYDVTYLTAVVKTELDVSPFKHIKFVCLNALRLRKSLGKLIQYFKENKPDIIISASDATLIVYMAKLLGCRSAKLITTHHNYYNNNAEVGFRHKLIIKYVYPLCNNIVAVSDGINLMLNTQFKLKKDKITTIYNPVDSKLIIESSLDIKENIPKNDYILFVGRLNAVKNLPLLFSAFKIFRQKYPNVKLILIGDGSEKENLRKIISNLNLSNYIEMIGVKSNPFPYIKNAKVIALSSASEALPTILIESLLLGRTIVSTPTKGAIDILKNGGLGYLSKSLTDGSDFAEKLILAYEKPLNKEDLVHEAMIKYDLEQKVLEFEKLWI